MSCKEAIYRGVFDSPTLQAVDAGGVIDLPDVTTSSQCAVTSSGGNITLRSSGTYEVHVNVTVSSAAAGTEDIQLYRNGSPVQGAHAQATAGAADTLVPLSFTALVTLECCNTESLSVRSGIATNIRIANVTLEKVH